MYKWARMSETAARFDVCTRALKVKPWILNLNRYVHLESVGIVLDGEIEAIGGVIQISYVATGNSNINRRFLRFPMSSPASPRMERR